MELNPTLPIWLSNALIGLAWLLGTGGIVKLITVYQNRQKPTADLHKSEAETVEIKVRAHSSAGDAVIKFMNRLDEAQSKIDTLHGDNNRLRDENGDLKQTVELQGMELQFGEKQQKKLKGLLDAHGIKYSESDEV